MSLSVSTHEPSATGAPVGVGRVGCAAAAGGAGTGSGVADGAGAVSTGAGGVVVATGGVAVATGGVGVARRGGRERRGLSGWRFAAGELCLQIGKLGVAQVEQAF